MDQLSESNTKSLADVQLPYQLEQRLAEEQERFHHPKSVDQEISEASARRDAVIQERVQHAHAEVQHAKQVAAAHHHRQQGDGSAATAGTGGDLAEGAEPGVPAALGARVTGSGNDATGVDELSRGVQEKQRAVEQQRAELSDLDARLAQAAKIEQDLRARLGEAV
ncbi:hypothetical protein JCM3774_004446 [Rhodotorula dairenensis]